MRFPWLVMLAVLVLAGAFLRQFPKVTFDNDPENMLDHEEAVRVFHRQVKARYALYDFVIVGIVNETHPDGIFNVQTLNRIDRLTHELISLRRNEAGHPIVMRASPDGRMEPKSLTLKPKGLWPRMLNLAFRQDPTRLFTDDGSSAIVGHEMMAPSVVDNIKQGSLGSLKLEYLMENPPRTREEALTIRADAMDNPLYHGTLVAEDGQAICIYIPLVAKTYSHNVAQLVRNLTDDWDGDDRVLITGQPVAQDTFGVEMLVQMATSAPLAGLAIFLLLLLFFKRLQLIVAPMLVAILSVIFAMGLLIGLGYDVHIMSSMIAIFLMPIAVADSVHILSLFFDQYCYFNDKRETLRNVMGELFMPMLYTSLTTIAGFASLATTPIPPVRVFGLHVAFGVAVAWLLTMVFVPAYIMLGVGKRTLERLSAMQGLDEHGRVCVLPGPLERFHTRLSHLVLSHGKSILALAMVVAVFAVAGLFRIQVNDNPVKWFTRKHPIRVADKVLNRHFGGTYTAYLTLEPSRPDLLNCHEMGTRIAAEARARFGDLFPQATEDFVKVVESMRQQFRNAHGADAQRCLVGLVERATAIDERALAGWHKLADEIIYLDPEGLSLDELRGKLMGMGEDVAGEREKLLQRVTALDPPLAEAALQNAALEICDEFTAHSLREFVFDMQAELTAPLFKRPETLRYVQRLQQHLSANPLVGKTSSAVDALTKASYELNYVAPPADADQAVRQAYAERNESHRAVPDTAAAIGQVFTQLEGMKRKDSLFHMITRDYQEAVIWVQLKSGDNVHMEAVVADAEDFLLRDPPPVDLISGWAGLTYLNVVWQDKMVAGMFGALGSSFIIVLLMMMLLFRSPLYGTLAMIPLSLTILFVYGLIGWVGKDYDMPIAVLSALTLGLSVDFAIHFLERTREEVAHRGSLAHAMPAVFGEAAMAISRNAITISIGFTPLLLASLVPYRTVGFFLAAIMAISWMATLLTLPPMLNLLRRRLFDEQPNKGEKRP